MNYTEQIQKHLKTEAEPSDDKYLCYNTGGVEVEVGEFLYALVRMLKPTNILETGTHLGVSGAYMAGALKDNAELGANGTLTTCEFTQANYDTARRLFNKMGLDIHIKQEFGDVAKFDPGNTQFGITFLDTEPQTRFAELVKFFPNVKDGGYVLIHDLHPHLGQEDNKEHGFAWPYGPIPSKMESLINDGKLIHVPFRTPRGLAMFYKPGEGDFYYGKKK